MLLKRKRSEPQLSSPASVPSSPPGLRRGIISDTYPGPWGNESAATARGYAPGRTLKRHRDNRPPEEQVY
ncbi:hypothetical protein E4U54_006838, partial [Claviceps lovelessii]